MKILKLASIVVLLTTLGLSAQTPSPTINGTPPPFTFTGGGVSQSGQTFTFSGGSGSGTVQSGSGYKFPTYSSSASTTIGPSNITTDATGNNLTVPGVFDPYNSNYAIFYADQFAGATADVKLNACLTAASALYIGGICDARGLSNGNQFLAATVTVPVRTALILPTSAIWICTATNSTPCILSKGGSAILGESPGGGGSTMQIIAGATANLSAIWKTDTSGGENAYILAGNFSLLNEAGGTVTYLADAEDMADQSWIHDIFAQNYTGNAWLITNDAFMTFSRIQGSASQSSPAGGTYSAGGVALTFGLNGSSYNESLMIEGSSFNAPITGSSNVVIAGSNTGITFFDDYFEGNGTVDTSTTMISVGSGNKGVQFIGGGVNDFCASTCASKYAFTNASTSPFSVKGMYGYNAAWINDTANSTTVANTTAYATRLPYDSAIPTSAGLLGSNAGKQIVTVTSIPSATTATTQPPGTNNTTVSSTAYADASAAAAGALAFPKTVSGTTTSGGMPYFSSTVQLSSSAILNANILIKGGGAGAAPSNSSITDNGTAVTTTDTGGYVGPTFTANGTTAGFADFPQGTTSAAVAPCNTATSICEQAPTAVTSYLVVKPGVAANGTMSNNVAAAVDTQGFSGDTNHSATVTIGSGTSIGSTSLCSTAICTVGTYRVNVYVDITTACGTTGTYVVNLIYTDDQGSKTIPVNIQGSGSVPLTGVLTTTSTANFGAEAQIIRSTGAASINYSTTAVACGTAGPMVGKLYLSVEPLQ